ncbi:hypothetical protein PLICRDRAFT_169692 [Plicaturopsis crispa FD-325 SS-3]|nr:hypothetical protein PLICRDRAFT_169692 [Plicaturopsis crispa FD-325 SS-3]
MLGPATNHLRARPITPAHRRRFAGALGPSNGPPAPTRKTPAQHHCATNHQHQHPTQQRRIRAKQRRLPSNRRPTQNGDGAHAQNGATVLAPNHQRPRAKRRQHAQHGNGAYAQNGGGGVSATNHRRRRAERHRSTAPEAARTHKMAAPTNIAPARTPNHTGGGAQRLQHQTAHPGAQNSDSAPQSQYRTTHALARRRRGTHLCAFSTAPPCAFSTVRTPLHPLDGARACAHS